MRKKHIVATVLAVCLVLQLSRGEELSCTAAKNGDQMIFNTSISHALDVDTLDCYYFWINGTNVTIADNSGQIPPVLKRSISSLTTSQCVEGIVSKLQCSSETTGMIDYSATCVVTCPGKDFSHGEEGTNPGEHSVWMWIGVGAGLVVLLGLALLGYKFRDKIWTKSTCHQCGGRYTNVKMQPTGSKQAEV